jgi:hypothetical protein
MSTTDDFNRDEPDTESMPIFGALTPQEAGRRSAQRRAERAAESDEQEAHGRRDEVVIVRTTVETGKVIDKLSRQAKDGNVQAARELRSWLAELPVETNTDLEDLDPRVRQQLLARLIAEIEESEEIEREIGEPLVLTRVLSEIAGELDAQV